MDNPISLSLKVPSLPNILLIAQIMQLMLSVWFWNYLHLTTLLIQTDNFLPGSAQKSLMCILQTKEEMSIPRYITGIFFRSSGVMSWFNQSKDMNFSSKTCDQYNKNETWSELACQPKKNYTLSLSSFGQETYICIGKI